MKAPNLKNDRPFQVLFSADGFAQLQEVAQDRGLSAGALIRELVRHAFQMRFEKRPRCASSKDCLVPQLHFQGPGNE
jgi:hypothetical protein